VNDDTLSKVAGGGGDIAPGSLVPVPTETVSLRAQGAARVLEASEAAEVLESLKERDGLYQVLSEGANSHLVVFDLTTVGIPSKHTGKRKYQLSKSGLEASMPSLIGKPIHVTADWEGHFEAGKAPKPIGVFLGSWTVPNEDESITLRSIGTLWNGDFADEVGVIRANKGVLGASYEIQYEQSAESQINENVVEIGAWKFTGGALLKRTAAAHPETRVLVATKSEEEPTMDMSKKYAGVPVEHEAQIEAIVASAVAAAVASVKGEQALDGLKSQIADAGKKIETQQAEIEALKKAAAAADAEKGQVEAKVFEVEAKLAAANASADAKVADLEKQIATAQASLAEKTEALSKIETDKKVEDLWASMKAEYKFDDKQRAEKEPLIRKQVAGTALSLDEMKTLFSGAGSGVKAPAAPKAPEIPTAATRTPLMAVEASTKTDVEPDPEALKQRFPAAVMKPVIR
jgi:hypothetical protein